jgi:glutaredoxin
LRALILFAALVLVGASAWLYSSSRLSAADFSPEHDIVIFTAPWCGYCDRARAYLVEQEAKFLEIDIESSAAANTQWRDAGGRGVPLAFFNDRRVSGYSPDVYGRLLDELSANLP